MKVSPGEGRNAVPLGWFHVYFSALQNFVLGLLCLVMSGYWTGVDAHSAADQGCLTEAHWAPINHKVADAACEGFARCQAWRQQRFWNTSNKHRFPVISWLWIQGSNHMVHFRVHVQLNHI